ncbi:MAG: hypothetical protein NWS01_06405 [Burkholderiales bacterium]|jgi:hypothetical protein|nr:hypothetical protein [Burkholderiales bacterium]
MTNNDLNDDKWDYERPVEGSSHLEAVMRWLDENQIHLDQPNSVTVKDFVVETEDHASFTLILDDKPYPERFECDTSLVEFDPLRLPIYCSPLGAPASYPVYDLTTATYCAVNNALRQANKLLNKAGVNVSDIAVTVDLDQYKDF